MSQKLFIDVDFAIKKHNEENPDNKLDRQELSEKLGITYQSLTNYQGGRIPKIISDLNNILSITGASYDDIVKTK